MKALVFVPGMGSMWMKDARIEYNQELDEKFVVGQVWVKEGNWNAPDDYNGLYETYHFPQRYIKKIIDEELKETK